MKSSRNVALWLYARFLRLYPPQFRVEFADELRDVFEQMVLEHDHPVSVLGLLAGEMWDLPASLLREHLRERRAKTLIGLAEEHIMAATPIPMRSFRFLTGALLVIFVMYCALILVPFFYYGLNMISWGALMSGLYDPKGYLPFAYDGIVGVVTRILGILVIILGPATVAAMGGVLVLTLRRHWRAFRQHQRVWAIAAVLAAGFMLVLTVSPFGHALFVWFMD